MRKLTVFIEGEKVVHFDSSILVTHASPHIIVKTATVFWDYDNVTTSNNEFLFESGNSLSAQGIAEGYYTFEALTKALKEKLKASKVSVTFERLQHSGKCAIKVDKVTYLKGLGVLLGFPIDHKFTVGVWHTSVNKVNINDGLKWVQVTCDIVDQEHNIGNDGARSDVIITLPIPNDQSSKGTIQRHTDIESKVTITKGVYSNMTFRVKSNNGVAIGGVLLELYIM